MALYASDTFEASVASHSSPCRSHTENLAKFWKDKYIFIVAHNNLCNPLCCAKSIVTAHNTCKQQLAVGKVLA